jgi:hypothetical protein
LETFGDEHGRSDVILFAGWVCFEVPEEGAGSETVGWVRGGIRGRFVETEVIVIEVAPRAGMFIDKANLN